MAKTQKEIRNQLVILVKKNLLLTPAEKSFWILSSKNLPEELLKSVYDDFLDFEKKVYKQLNVIIKENKPVAQLYLKKMKSLKVNLQNMEENKERSGASNILKQLDSK
jgi:hypothetical protein